MRVGGIDSSALKQYIEKIERLETEKSEIADYIRDTYSEAKSNGFDPKIMKSVIKERKLDQDQRNEIEHLLNTYKAALGMSYAEEEEVIEAVA